MRDLSQLPNKLDPDKATCRALIETPRHHRCKFDYDVKSGLFRLKSMLPAGMSFPMDFGFIPSTLCDDGDPLDVMVLNDEPLPVGTLLDVRLLGVIEAEESEKGKVERNDRIVATSLVSQLYAKVRRIDDLEPTFVDHLTSFWVTKNKLEGKGYRILDVGDPGKAVKLVQDGVKTAKKAA